MAGVFVVGSINQDFVLGVERRPGPGETITGADLALFPGGKGANQAIAAARLGAKVAMLGRVGGDAFGTELIENLRHNRVDTSHIQAVPDAPTGSAFITVTPDGENAIVVSPGANRRLGSGEVEAAAGDIRGGRLLVAQVDVSMEAVERAARIAEEAGTRFLLNLAPPREVPDDLLRLSDPLVVNEHEARAVLGEDAGPASTPVELAAALARRARSAVVTLGGDGAVVASPDLPEPLRLPAPAVEVVDTTGAGDAFVGTLAAELARGAPLPGAAQRGVAAGALAVETAGAVPSLPSRGAVDDRLRQAGR